MGGHPSFELGGGGTRKWIRGGLGVSWFVGNSEGGIVGSIVEGIFGIALVGLLRHAIALHSGQEAQGTVRRRRQERRQKRSARIGGGRVRDGLLSTDCGWDRRGLHRRDSGGRRRRMARRGQVGARTTIGCWLALCCDRKCLLMRPTTGTAAGQDRTGHATSAH